MGENEESINHRHKRTRWRILSKVPFRQKLRSIWHLPQTLNAKLLAIAIFRHLAAQSFVGASFEQPIGTGEVTGLGVTRILEARIGRRKNGKPNLMSFFSPETGYEVLDKRIAFTTFQADL